jgi:predicted phage terminase large subunit-like protein
MSIKLAANACPTPADLLRDECDALRYEDSLIDFIGDFWHVVEASQFQSSWHIEAICEHLEAVADQQIKRGLLINIPPRHMKSLAANVFFPAWTWAQNPNPENDPTYKFQIRKQSWRGPGVKFMHLSYEAGLATRDGGRCRRIIESPDYLRLWGDRVRMLPDQREKRRFGNRASGARLSTSEGGVITGEGADIIVFDDPHNVKKIGGDSDVAREATLRFWDEALPSRISPQGGVFVVIMQRVHERDLSAHILATEMGWTHLCLPATYEPNHPTPIKTAVVRKATNKVWQDPRQPDEPLWPERFPLEKLKQIAKDEHMSSHVAAGQLQQRPSAREGGMFKRKWFDNPVKFAPEGLQRVRAWDLAASAEGSGGDPDFTVGLLVGRDPNSNVIYILDVVRGRWSPAEVENKIKSTALLDGEETRIRIPQEPGAAGKFQAGYLAQRLIGYSVTTEPEQGSKDYRANPLVAQCEPGFVKLVEGAWNQAFIDELCAFPNGAHDDQVDAASGAFRALVRRVTWSAA